MEKDVLTKFALFIQSLLGSIYLLDYLLIVFLYNDKVAVEIKYLAIYYVIYYLKTGNQSCEM